MKNTLISTKEYNKALNIVQRYRAQMEKFKNGDINAIAVTYNTRMWDLDLSIRGMHVLESCGIITIEDFMKIDLKKFKAKNCGKRTLEEFEEIRENIFII